MIELLAPGGSYEGLVAAVNAGADAVYMGGQRFGARAYAQNPEEQELLSAMDYCHLHDRKLYLTVNTLLKEQELEGELYDYLLPLYEHGLDAVLVQDFGVFRFIKRNFPDLPLHASTQMTITGINGARMLKEMGAERIVPARELTLEEIRGIHREVDIEIECFVHGALCYCYSGQCLMSSLIGGRSGNRGRCAQPCRLPYDLYRDSVKQNKNNERYLLSLKDICTLELLPDLMEAGVCSFKIEGRMKRPEYAAGVTEIYRRYIDTYLKNGRKDYRVDPGDERILMDLYNRGGFSEGYYRTYNGKKMMAMERPNHWGTPAARVIGGKKDEIHLEALEPLWEKDALEAGSGTAGGKGQRFAETAGPAKEWILKENVPAGKSFVIKGNPRLVKQNQVLARVRSEKLLQELHKNFLEGEIREKIKGKFILEKENSAILTVNWKDYSVTAAGDPPMIADKRPLDEETVRRQLLKTGNTPFVFETLEVELQDGLFYPMQSLNELRRTALEQLREKILESCRRADRREAEPNRDGQHGEEQYGNRQHEEKAASGFGELQEADRKEIELRASAETPEQFYTLLEIPFISGVYLDCCMFLNQNLFTFRQVIEKLHDSGKKAYLAMPAIWREKSIRAFETQFSEGDLELWDGFLLRSNEQLEYLRRFAGRKEMIADSGIYTYNREAREFLREWGISRDTLPLECNRRELRQRGCRGSECIVYGYLPLMVTAQCLVKNTSGCKKTPGVYQLRDRKNADFPVRNQCAVCTNVIYNSVPLDLISDSKEIRELQPSSCRLSFTFEDGAEVRRIAEAAKECFLEKKTLDKVISGGTRGHFKRGVE